MVKSINMTFLAKKTAALNRLEQRPLCLSDKTRPAENEANNVMALATKYANMTFLAEKYNYIQDSSLENAST